MLVCFNGQGGQLDLNFAGAAIFLSMLAAVCVVLWGLFSRRRSVVVGVITASVALLATVGAWYAWAESRSTPWTLGYAAVVVISVAATVRQCARGASSRQDP